MIFEAIHIFIVKVYMSFTKNFDEDLLSPHKCPREFLWAEAVIQKY